MDRGLSARLSPNEELTLRRVGHGLANPKELREADLSRLRMLKLIVGNAGVLRTTELGRRRLEKLPANSIQLPVLPSEKSGDR